MSLIINVFAERIGTEVKVDLINCNHALAVGFHFPAHNKDVIMTIVNVTSRKKLVCLSNLSIHTNNILSFHQLNTSTQKCIASGVQITIKIFSKELLQNLFSLLGEDTCTSILE